MRRGWRAFMVSSAKTPCCQELRIVEHGQVAAYSACVNLPLIDGAQHSASRFMLMQAIAKPTTLRVMRNFREAMLQFVRRNMPGGKVPDPGRIYDANSAWQFEQTGCAGCMTAVAFVLGEIARGLRGAPAQRVHKRGFADP